MLVLCLVFLFYWLIFLSALIYYQHRSLYASIPNSAERLTTPHTTQPPATN